jgi:quinohemoprotein ethanol dehydrogenase
VMAPPVTYRIDGVQYLAVSAGWGGGWPLTGGVMALQAGDSTGPNRLLVFKLDGSAKLPPAPQRQMVRTAPPPDRGSTAEVARGDALYGRNCLRCHGSGAVSAGPYPDLRWTPLLTGEGFDQVVLGGALKQRGMPGFGSSLTPADLQALRAYLIRRAHQDHAKGL